MGSTKLSMWWEQPRALRADNLGPIVGAHEIGSISGPGIYRVVERNAGGKSTVLRALLKMQGDKLLRKDMQIRDGEIEATIELEPGRMTFRRGPTGELRDPERAGIDGMPPIAEMPSAIDTLIHGDHLQDPDARARRRFKALLDYAPVESTMDRFNGLMQTCSDPAQKRAFALITDEERRAWQSLAESARDGKKRMRVEPVRTPEEIREWLLGVTDRDGSILTDHELLVGICNATANTGEHAADEARRRLTMVQGRLAESIANAEREFGFGARSHIEKQYDVTALRLASESRAIEAEKLRTARASLVAEEGRRAKLAESHGERPAEFVPVDYESEYKAAIEWNTLLEGYRSEFRVRAVAVTSSVPVSEDDELRMRAVLEELAAHSRQSHRSPGEIREKMREQDEDRFKAQQALRAWDTTNALLSEPLEGPTEEQVAEATKAAEDARRLVRIAQAATAHQAIAAEHNAALELVARVDALAKSYREAAADSWGYLGRILTDALELPWLQIDGLKLFVGYVGDQLNNDPALIRAAEDAAEKMALAQDHTSPVALGRFLMEAIRDASDIEWRDLDDEMRISTAELHEACLSLMLARRAKLGGIVVVPWEVVAAMDDERLVRFDEKVVEAGLVLISERPRRSTDPEGIFLERVGAK